MTPAKNKKIIMAVTVSEAKRMLKIVAKLVVGLAKALAPTVICHKLWTMGATIRFRCQSLNYSIRNITNP